MYHDGGVFLFHGAEGAVPLFADTGRSGLSGVATQKTPDLGS